MTKTTRKTSRKLDQEFKTWLDRFSRKYEDVIKELARGGRRAASDEEVRNKLSELNKRHKKLYQDLAKS